MNEVASLPDEPSLRRLYDTFRTRYFKDGEKYLIPPVDEVCIEWSNRLTSSAGICYPKRRIIRLSTHYHRAYPDDIESTLLHEMIHLLVPGHGPQFHRWLERIQQYGGRIARYAKSRATAHEPPRWRYRCRSCGAEWFRYRRLKHGGRDYIHKGCGGRLQELPLPSR